VSPAALVSFGAAALGALALGLVLAVGWRGNLRGGLLLIAALATLAWAVILGGLVQADAWSPAAIQVAETLRYGAWFAFLLGLLYPVYHPFLWRLLATAGGVLLAAQLGMGLLGGGGFSAAVAGAVPYRLPVAGGVLITVFGLFLLEQVFRGTHPDRRWAAKYMVLGVGGLFLFDFYLYADGLLLGQLDPYLWIARGLVAALVMPLVAVSAARNPEWSLDVYVSRKAVTHTAAITAAGGYLLVMATVGYYVRALDGSWGGAAQALFLFAAFLLLVSALFSGQLRARARVFFSKHFFNYKYDYREEWLRFTRTLSRNDEGLPLRERVVRAIAQIVDSPGGELWQRRGDGFVPTATWNRPPGDAEAQESADSPLVTFLRTREWVLERGEWERYPLRYGGVPLPRWMRHHRAAWLVVPLIHKQDLEGFLVLDRPRAAFAFNWEDCDLLKAVGRQAASALAQEEASEALGEARQFEAFSKVSAFVAHDLKNIVGQLSLVTRNAKRHQDNPAFVADAFATVDNAVDRLNRLLHQLRGGEEAPPEPVDLAAVLRKVVADHQGREPQPELGELPETAAIEADPYRLEAVLGHLLQNAQEATPATGRVRVALVGTAEGLALDVTDEGEGMAPEFIRDRLFRPFDTTKGQSGMGIGAYEIREFMHGLGGEVAVTSQPDAGTRFRLIFPVKESAPAADSATHSVKEGKVEYPYPQAANR
jgi:putative PEP-CTERM system histidine kinase